ncbi:SRPBCC domain-containing protein [Myroides sp. JBRI-B21084]|uniref:SRPBCC domain-containing protein n=1 Tax=Myroides sp. JBRI-B21084 TaxID=3119977 RepID=UPI0026E2D16D|nr:SRPBCC domain-containing protein [Paenimyroides cloacae]WKW46508.1 SRPBCC domain-containing protein [Paenimyroides cloacae]
MEKLTAKASIQIQKKVNDVFDAIIMANKMSNYFIESGTGNLETNQTVYWKFPEFNDTFPVIGKKIIPNEYISFSWNPEPNMFVEIFLQSHPDQSTVVKIIEHEMDRTEEGIKKMMQQTEGWANFLACLKASLEYNINLRKGAFEFMSTK